MELWAWGDSIDSDLVDSFIAALPARLSEPLPWAVHDSGDSYWRGTEAGLLGAYDWIADLVATDGSVSTDGTMGAGAV
eukprot:1682602-Rhodomonas_salina.1